MLHRPSAGLKPSLSHRADGGALLVFPPRTKACWEVANELSSFVDSCCRHGSWSDRTHRAGGSAESQPPPRLRFLQGPGRADLLEEEGGTHPLRGVPLGIQ